MIGQPNNMYYNNGTNNQQFGYQVYGQQIFYTNTQVNSYITPGFSSFPPISQPSFYPAMQQNPMVQQNPVCSTFQQNYMIQQIMEMFQFLMIQQVITQNNTLQKIHTEKNGINNLVNDASKTYKKFVDEKVVAEKVSHADDVLAKATESENPEAIAEAQKAVELAARAEAKMNEIKDLLNDAKSKKITAASKVDDADKGKASASQTLADLKAIRKSLASLPDVLAQKIQELDEFIEEAEAQIQKAEYAVSGGLEFDKINSDDDEKITKEELSSHIKKYGLKDNANANLTDEILNNLMEEIGGDNEEITKAELQKYLDKDNDGIVEKSEINQFNSKLQLNTDVLNNAKEWKADGGYGKIDWNKDGTFGNDGGGHSYLTTHGDLDGFFTNFGKEWKTPQLKNIVDNMDNSSKDKDSRAGYVSDGKTTAHRISDTQIGFNITEKDKSVSAGVDYNYVVWDEVKNAYIIGNDKNADGLLKEDEILGIVENLGASSKTASPLIFDLNGNGKVDTSNINKDFDIDGDGKTDKTAWAGIGDGVLAIDADKNGIVGENGKEIFGNNTDIDGDGNADGFANGFDALKALADKYLGAASVADNKLDTAEIKALEEKAGLTMLVNGENKSLEELGITEISLGYAEKDIDKSKDKYGNEHRQIGEGFVINGQQNKVDDVWLRFS